MKWLSNALVLRAAVSGLCVALAVAAGQPAEQAARLAGELVKLFAL